MPTSDFADAALKAIDWVHRAGWCSRARDDAMARWVYQDWRQAVHDHHQERANPSDLLRALRDVFADSHDSEGRRIPVHSL
jgi:hypothetical protein